MEFLVGLREMPAGVPAAQQLRGRVTFRSDRPVRAVAGTSDTDRDAPRNGRGNLCPDHEGAVFAISGAKAGGLRGEVKREDGVPPADRVAAGGQSTRYKEYSMGELYFG